MTGRSGRLIVISGPSGVGKGSVVAGLRRRRPDLDVSVSATTRPRRPHERDGVDYYFVDDARFDRLLADGGLLEWAEFAGRRYGTPHRQVCEALAAGRDLVLEIDVQGARQVRARRPDALLVLLVPPSLEVLAERLQRRGTETGDDLAARLAVARNELAHRDLFDHVVVNDRLEDAVAALDSILGLDGR